jgi:hypothetical protein
VIQTVNENKAGERDLERSRAQCHSKGGSGGCPRRWHLGKGSVSEMMSEVQAHREDGTSWYVWECGVITWTPHWPLTISIAVAHLLVLVSCFLWPIFHTGSLSDSFQMQMRSCSNTTRASTNLLTFRTTSKVLTLPGKIPYAPASCLSNLSSYFCLLTGLLVIS